MTTLQQLLEDSEKEFYNKYRESIHRAYPEYKESHNILLADIWNQHKSQLERAYQLGREEVFEIANEELQKN